jgi:transposase
MPGKAAKILISERQQLLLQEFSKSRTVGKCVSQRATIILLGFQGLFNEQIALQVGLNRQQVGLWRQRWRDAWESLCVWECAEPHRLREAILDLLADAPRPGAPATFTAAQVSQVVALACEPPKLSGRPIDHWTLRELRDEALTRQLVAEISVSQVGRFLQQAAVQPHRKKMWLNTTEKDPQKFQAEVENVCQTYLEAAAKAATAGTHTVSVDEATALQAIERNAPDKPAQPDRVAKQEFEYTRHGTTTLTAGLDVVTGLIVCPTLEATRTEPEFVAHIARTVDTDAAADWIFVIDCLNTHVSESLVKFVAERCAVPDALGKKNARGILKSMATRRAFLADSQHRIRFVYLPKHSSWLNQIEIVFGIIHRKLLRCGNFTSVPDLEAQLRAFMDYYNATMAHPFAWTYTGKPVQKQRRARFVAPHRRRKLGKVQRLAKAATLCNAV